MNINPDIRLSNYRHEKIMHSAFINQLVRILSIIWMFGVIAAQIQGGAPFLSIVFGLPLLMSQFILAVGIA